MPATEPGDSGVRSFVEELAVEAGIVDARRFADIWCMLMNGAVIAANAADGDAARKAGRAAEHVLAAWRLGGME